MLEELVTVLSAIEFNEWYSPSNRRYSASMGGRLNDDMVPFRDLFRPTLGAFPCRPLAHRGMGLTPHTDTGGIANRNSALSTVWGVGDWGTGNHYGFSDAYNLATSLSLSARDQMPTSSTDPSKYRVPLADPMVIAVGGFGVTVFV